MSAARITDRDLLAQVARLNRVSGFSTLQWLPREDDSCAARPAPYNYHIDHGYGGVSLHQHGSEGSGARDVFGCGHVSKRELFNLVCAYIAGIEYTMRYHPNCARNAVLATAPTMVQA